MMCVVAVANMPTNTSMSSETSSSPIGGAVTDHNKPEPNNNNSSEEHPVEQRQNSSGDNNVENIPTPDDFGSTDEVKVFNEEDDRDGDASESYQAELQAEKSSLIHESEQVSLNLSHYCSIYIFTRQ